MKMEAYPTRYKDQLFRSRLEARWAAFFDLLCWPYVYEPFDLKGYIPDFILKFYKPLLVEIKPEFSLEALDKHKTRILLSGWDKEILIVGADLFNGRQEGMPGIGLLGQRMANDQYDFSEGILFDCRVCGRSSILHSIQSFHCRIKGCYDGDHHIGPLKFNAAGLWALAHEKTRWCPGADEEDHPLDDRTRRLLPAEARLLDILIESESPLSPELMNKGEAASALTAIRRARLCDDVD